MYTHYIMHTEVGTSVNRARFKPLQMWQVAIASHTHIYSKRVYTVDAL
jgi:hypothetical protein